MLTVEKLAILIRYQWDFRRFRSQATAQEKELMDIDWHDLAEMLQDLRLLHKNLLSKEYASKLYADLLAGCADEATAQTLLGYASTL